MPEARDTVGDTEVVRVTDGSTTEEEQASLFEPPISPSPSGFGAGGERRQLTGTSLERTRAVVEEVLAKAGRDGERVVSYARLALGGLIALLWPAATWDELLAGVSSDFAVIGLSVAACAFSAWMLIVLRRGALGPVMRYLSIVADAVLVLGLLASFVAHPPPSSYFGVGRISGLGAAYFAILAAGIRLSRRGAVVSLLLFFLGVGGLMSVDHMVNDVDDTAGNGVTIGVFLVTAGIFAWLIASRTRTIVLEGAAQTLMAERARTALGSYVSEEVAEVALKTDQLRLGGARQDLAVLFSDLRSFTTASEKANPEQLVRELNEYFEFMVAAVTREGGVVDKYIGDSIMAVFGAPMRHDDDAVRAVKAAYAMERALERLNASRVKRGLAALKHGIGVHYGTAVAGNIGTTQRAQYTVIGDTVNVAARLESCTKEAGVSVLLSDALIVELKRETSSDAKLAASLPALTPMGDVKAKGREEKIAVHTFASDPPARVA